MKIVEFTYRDGEAPVPAIITKDWGDGNYQLFVFNFEGPSLIRAAHFSQIRLLFDPSVLQELVQDMQSALQRILELENDLNDIRKQLTSIKPEEPAQVVDASELTDELLDPPSVMDDELAPLAIYHSEEEAMAAKEAATAAKHDVESTRDRRRKAAWPT